MKNKETLEEAYNKIYKEIDFSEFDFASFAIGAKWQSERRYSEEEVFDLIEKAIEDKYANLRYWFEQFKKK